MNIGVIGLGQMGGAISKNLLKTGFHVSGYDILPKMLDHLAENGGDPLGSVQAIANACDLIILSIPSTDSLFDVTSKIIRRYFQDNKKWAVRSHRPRTKYA